MEGGGGGGGAPATGGVQDFLAIELWTMGGRQTPLPTPMPLRSDSGDGGGGGGGGPSNLFKMLLLIKVVVYPSYNDIHVFFLSEISSQRSRH